MNDLILSSFYPLIFRQPNGKLEMKRSFQLLRKRFFYAWINSANWTHFQNFFFLCSYWRCRFGFSQEDSNGFSLKFCFTFWGKFQSRVQILLKVCFENLSSKNCAAIFFFQKKDKKKPFVVIETSWRYNTPRVCFTFPKIPFFSPQITANNYFPPIIPVKWENLFLLFLNFKNF